MISQENIPIKTGLLDLLRGSMGAQFVIPAYQRNYTWTANREVKQLLEDVLAVLKGERNKHFIGIMIYLEKTLSPFQRERSVIDGQQRLTTIFLLLYAIKELMLEHKMDKDAETLENMYLVNQFNETNKFKLKPLVSDDTVYQHIVRREFEQIEDSKSKVYLNFCHVKSTFVKWMQEYTINDILTSLNKLYLVCVPISDDDYPQKIFESINATGAKLTASDLIRNFILMPIESNLQDQYYENYWKKLECLIDSDSSKLESFFRFFIMAKKQAMINKNAVYRAFTEWHTDNIDEYGVEGIFKEVVRYANYYNIIYKAPVQTLNPDIKKAIEEFRLILSEMPAPLLMEFYSLYYNNKISGSQLSSIIMVLDSYLMRRALCGMDTSDITRYFPTLLKETISDCNGVYDNIVEIFKKNVVTRNKGTSQEMPDNKKLQDRIQNANMYNLRIWLNIFFRKLESEDNPAVVDFSSLSIEHLMPQTPTTAWLESLDCDKETYEENLHRLGNLTLAARSDNSKMGNKVWEFKNKILASTAHLKMNQELLKKEHWTLADIDERTQQLIVDISRLYPYYDAKESTITRYSIYIEYNGGYAQGYYYPDNGSVEVLEGSSLNTDMQNINLYPEIEALRAELIENEVVREINGKLVFATNYFFYPKRVNATALSTAAAVILHGSRNGWEYWLTEGGTQIGKIEGLRKGKET